MSENNRRLYYTPDHLRDKLYIEIGVITHKIRIKDLGVDDLGVDLYGVYILPANEPPYRYNLRFVATYNPFLTPHEFEYLAESIRFAIVFNL